MARKVAKNNMLMQCLWTETIWPRPGRDAKALAHDTPAAHQGPPGIGLAQ